ncbi:hypothetical protein DFJ58DRAFT_736763 [Suillus subalutaceus]|uniref:uncharacterized protein n=1 Tax=Suillus subalutaceus TaxID=48586 RepID=UPI001B88340A|nr:uncharacterized protein DFJ58DRAFT_736763 [Suillus subalutaceus]KAG1831163.1 hypothetical protein DFJ58DRAFT_736763 [Suillus subalutaceus]
MLIVLHLRSIAFWPVTPGVQDLSIIPRPGCLWRTHRVNPPLVLSVSTLDGPLSHVLPVLRSHHKPPTLSCLALSLQAHDASPDYLTAVLQCIRYCNSVGYLDLSLPPQSHSHSAMIYSGTQSAIHVKHLGIFSDVAGSCSTSAGDALLQALSASWIEAFPRVKRVSMRGCSNRTAEYLVNKMRKFAAADVELSVKLHTEDSL